MTKRRCKSSYPVGRQNLPEIYEYIFLRRQSGKQQGLGQRWWGRRRWPRLKGPLLSSQEWRVRWEIRSCPLESRIRPLVRQRSMPKNIWTFELRKIKIPTRGYRYTGVSVYALVQLPTPPHDTEGTNFFCTIRIPSNLVLGTTDTHTPVYLHLDLI